MERAEPQPSVPRHVAVIMDGNGRWARARGLPRIEGHRAGARSVRRIVEACHDVGVEYLTLYAFSTENWIRPAAEVSALMALLVRFLNDRAKDLDKYRIRLNAIGELDRLPAAVRRRLDDVISRTRDHDRGTLTLALSYGSRAEIAHAAREIAGEVRAGTLDPAAVDEGVVARHLYTNGLPDPDLVIRTAGEMRLSNFLLWQLSYAEFWVTDVCWPDFGKREFRKALQDYSLRRRRFGGVVDA